MVHQQGRRDRDLRGAEGADGMAEIPLGLAKIVGLCELLPRQRLIGDLAIGTVRQTIRTVYELSTEFLPTLPDPTHPDLA
jgi:hypothetical protein